MFSQIIRGTLGDILNDAVAKLPSFTLFLLTAFDRDPAGFAEGYVRYVKGTRL